MVEARRDGHDEGTQEGALHTQREGGRAASPLHYALRLAASAPPVYSTACTRAHGRKRDAGAQAKNALLGARCFGPPRRPSAETWDKLGTWDDGVKVKKGKASGGASRGTMAQPCPRNTWYPRVA